MAATNDNSISKSNSNNFKEPTLSKSIPYSVKINSLHITDSTKTIVDELTLLDVLGKGGQGVTYKGLSKMYGNVAIKIIMKHKIGNIKHIINEISTLNNISETCKDYLLCIYYCGEDANSIYIVTEYIDGTNMNNMVLDSRYKFNEHSISLAICSIINGLQILHTKYGIAHRDIKLDNIMFSKPKKNFKIIDYGFSCIDEPGMLSSCPNNPGTLLYMAPEVIIGNTVFNKPTDIWSLGIVILFLILRLNNQMELIETYGTHVESYHKYKSLNSIDYPINYLENQIKKILESIDTKFKPILLSMIITDPLYRNTIDKIVNDVKILCNHQ